MPRGRPPFQRTKEDAKMARKAQVRRNVQAYRQRKHSNGRSEDSHPPPKESFTFVLEQWGQSDPPVRLDTHLWYPASFAIRATLWLCGTWSWSPIGASWCQVWPTFEGDPRFDHVWRLQIPRRNTSRDWCSASISPAVHIKRCYRLPTRANEPRCLFLRDWPALGPTDPRSRQQKRCPWLFHSSSLPHADQPRQAGTLALAKQSWLLR